MTKEQAIDLLDNLIGFVEDNHGSDYDGALEIAIKALEREPCKDAVSREDVMKCFKKWQPYMSIGVWNYERELSKIPSVTLKPKTGRWIECEYNGMGFIKCSECLSGFLSANLLRNSYCPNCGCRMNTESEET